MSKNIRVALAQLNLTVGDFKGNLAKHLAAADQAHDQLKADIIVFPELGLLGYPPDDLLFRDSFIEEAEETFANFTQQAKNIYCLVCHIQRTPSGMHNACSMVYNGKILGTYYKHHLPNYGVFDEKRYFMPGFSPCVLEIKGIRFGVTICEDLWVHGPVEQAVKAGAQVILSPNASPFEVGKHNKRLDILKNYAIEHNIALCYTNNVGGQDSIIFDGGSMAVNADGQIARHAGFFKENLLPVDITLNDGDVFITPDTTIELPGKDEKVYQALCMSLKDYIQKNGFKKVILGLSGGIDSALTLTVAVDALGKDNVSAVIMPSRYTADMSIEDAEKLANNLGVAHQTISIEESYQAFVNSLKVPFENTEIDLTEENIQARCRAIILMALSNKFGALVLSTSNRSETAVGYSTLYGDMAGGFAVLKDIPKTMVYRLSRYRNSLQNDIPERILTRPPSAELAYNQTDQDSLPHYDILDDILERYVNNRESAEDIIAAGFDQEVVKKVIRLVRLNEYKRIQSPLGPRINNRAFGRDRRYPVTNKFEG